MRKARSNAADVFLYRDSSIDPLLDLRRRLKAVMDVLDCHDSSWSLSFTVA